MKNKILVCCAAVSVITLGIIFAVVSRGNDTTFTGVFKTRPYDSGYSYKGTGTVEASVDEEGIKTISGFPEGEAGQVFLDMLNEDISSMDMRIELSGQGKGSSTSTMLKLITADGTEYESRYYTDGLKKWFFICQGGKDGKWSEAVPSDGIENITSSIEIESLERIKDSMILKSQGENSSTFHVELNHKNAELFFGEEEKRFFESLGDDFGELINAMGMSIEIETFDRVDVFTEYAKISNIKVSFVLPYNKTGLLVNGRIKELGEEEKKIFDSMYMKVDFTMDFNYEEVEPERPVTA